MVSCPLSVKEGLVLVAVNIFSVTWFEKKKREKYNATEITQFSLFKWNHPEIISIITWDLLLVTQLLKYLKYDFYFRLFLWQKTHPHQDFNECLKYWSTVISSVSQFSCNKVKKTNCINQWSLVTGVNKAIGKCYVGSKLHPFL